MEEILLLKVTTEDNKNRKYQDNGCSFVVEVQPGYQSDEADVNRGSSDDMPGRVTDQQALVHREEIPEDHSCSKYYPHTPLLCDTLNMNTRFKVYRNTLQILISKI